MSQESYSSSQSNSIKLEQQQEAEKLQNEQNSDPQRDPGNIPSKKRIHKKSDISNFIMKTYKILEEKRNSHIIQWTEGGNCFIVKNKDQFQSEILPKYFKHNKFSSFVRQLNMYDFHKIRKQKEIPIFKHKFFKMGCPQLLHKIKRKSGEQAKEQEGKNMQSLYEIGNKNEELNLKSSISVKSKAVLNIREEIQNIQSENKELKLNLHQIDKEISILEQKNNKKQEKLIKILSTLTYFDVQDHNSSFEEKYSLRELQNHVIEDDDAFSFGQYAKKLGAIFRNIKNSLIA